MNKLRIPFILILLIISISCTKKEEPQKVELQPVYSTPEEFVSALDTLNSLIEMNNVLAYQDTLENGYPNIEGESFPLSGFVSGIMEKYESGDEQGAVNDIFHFDGTPYSLISYLMKASMLEQISNEMLANAMALIPLPPFQVAGFAPPKQPVKKQPPPPQQCNCDPKMKILVTWSYRPACGNYEKEISGYAANNTLTNRPSGTNYRFDAEIDGCKCGGTTTVTLDAPPNGAYGFGQGKDYATLFSQSSGTYKITFTYKCGCGCGKSVTETFTINFR